MNKNIQQISEKCFLNLKDKLAFSYSNKISIKLQAVKKYFVCTNQNGTGVPIHNKNRMYERTRKRLNEKYPLRD